MIIRFEDLKNHPFTLSDIAIYYQRPSYRFLDVTSRKYNGFLCITKGEGKYEFENTSFSLAPGTIVYLPIGSVHKLTVFSDDFQFYRIDFKVYIENQLALFSDFPIKITDSVSNDCMQAIRTLLDDYQFSTDTVAKTELLCRIFRTAQTTSHSLRALKLAPSIQFIRDNLTSDINCKYLAKLCCLSTAQFYNLFQLEYQTTPLGYRNELLLQRAIHLLRNEEFSVTEISEMLGFESVAYFSRFFKKHQGVSPSEYYKH